MRSQQMKHQQMMHHQRMQRMQQIQQHLPPAEGQHHQQQVRQMQQQYADAVQQHLQHVRVIQANVQRLQAQMAAQGMAAQGMAAQGGANGHSEQPWGEDEAEEDGDLYSDESFATKIEAPAAAPTPAAAPLPQRHTTGFPPQQTCSNPDPAVRGGAAFGHMARQLDCYVGAGATGSNAAAGHAPLSLVATMSMAAQMGGPPQMGGTVTAMPPPAKKPRVDAVAPQGLPVVPASPLPPAPPESVASTSSLEMHLAMWDVLPHAVFVRDRRGDVLFANASGLHIAGCPPGAIPEQWQLVSDQRGMLEHLLAPTGADGPGPIECMEPDLPHSCPATAVPPELPPRSSHHRVIVKYWVRPAPAPPPTPLPLRAPCPLPLRAPLPQPLRSTRTPPHATRGGGVALMTSWLAPRSHERHRWCSRLTASLSGYRPPTACALLRSCT